MSRASGSARSAVAPGGVLTGLPSEQPAQRLGHASPAGGHRRRRRGTCTVANVREVDRIRRAAADEAAAVAALWLRSRRAAAPAIPPPVHRDDEVKAWFRDVVLAAGEVWVIGPRRSPVAMLALRPGWIEQLYVAPDRLRQGHGSRLVGFAQSRHPELSLWTFAANAAARAFYERHGFIAVGVSADNEEGVPAVRYRWAEGQGRSGPPATGATKASGACEGRSGG